MNPLVKKEIRLLLPGFLIGIALTFGNCFLTADQLGLNKFVSVVSFVSCSAIAVFLALNSFGAEISAGTFSMLLAQPVSRQRIWRTKTLLLAAALFIGGFLRCAILYLRFEVFYHPKGLGDFWDIFVGTWVFLPVIYSGALWTVLLLRQMAAAFWFTLLTPGAIVMVIAGLWPEKYYAACEPAVITVMLVYSGAGFWIARRLFLRAQDVAWTGGVISFPAWRYFETGSKSSISIRRRKPISALLKKEFQLQSISWFCAAVLLALHIGVFFLRIFYANHHKNSLAAGVSDFFWMLWLIIPLVFGCTAVAEERKLGVTEEQLCLPVSRRLQFAIKLIPTMLFGTLLGGILPILLETVAAYLGAQCDYFRPDSFANGEFVSGFVLFQISVVALAAGLALAGFFASTHAKNFIQALGIAIVTGMSCVLFTSFLAFIIGRRITFFGITPWHSILPFLIAIPTIPATLLWLAWLNFNHFHENWRLWRRNILGVTGAFVFVVVSSAAIYNRAWEIFEPAEPSHGPVKLSLANPPKLNGEYENLLVRLPDGRVWFNSLSWDLFQNQPSRWKELWLQLAPPLPKSTGPQQFIAGSNWLSATAGRVDWWNRTGTTPSNFVHVVGYLDTVGIRRDGTLWISSKSVPEVWTGDKMTQFGDETDWQQVASGRWFGSFLLLKNDGTLWSWGTNRLDWDQSRTNWPTVRSSRPQQIGTNSDWKEVFHGWVGDAIRTDGSVWFIGFADTTKEYTFERQTNLVQDMFQTLSRRDNVLAYVGKGGTLWFDRYWNETRQTQGTGFLQVGRETNWTAVAVTWSCLVALKSDGSLWKWDFLQDYTTEVAKIAPIRLGIHNDWVGLTSTWGGFVSMAADGSLWLWPPDDYGMALLKPPKQPEFLGNVFAKADGS